HARDWNTDGDWGDWRRRAAAGSDRGRGAEPVWRCSRDCDRDGSFISDHATLWMAGAGFAYGDCRCGRVLDGSGNFLRLLSGANGGAAGHDRGVEIRVKPSWAVGRWPFVRC